MDVQRNEGTSRRRTSEGGERVYRRAVHTDKHRGRHNALVTGHAAAAVTEEGVARREPSARAGVDMVGRRTPRNASRTTTLVGFPLFPSPCPLAHTSCVYWFCVKWLCIICHRLRRASARPAMLLPTTLFENRRDVLLVSVFVFMYFIYLRSHAHPHAVPACLSFFAVTC